LKNNQSLRHGKLATLALFLSSIVAVLLAAEISLRLFYPLISDYDLEMFRYAAYGKMPGSVPGLSHKHKPGAYFNKLYGVEVKINSNGLRDYEYSFKKPLNTYRILVLGDSITFGWGVPFEKVYSKVLESRLNKNGDRVSYQVINAGVGNYQIKDEVSLLKYEGMKYDPDMIILGYFVDDPKINETPRFFYLKKYSYLYAFLSAHLNAIKIKLFPEEDYYHYYARLYEPHSKTIDNLFENLSELRSIVEKKDIPILIVLIPDIHNIRNYPFKGVYKLIVTEFGMCNNANVIDLMPYFDTKIDPRDYWVTPEDPHHNAEAHRIIAEAIYPEIIKLKGRRTVDR